MGGGCELSYDLVPYNNDMSKLIYIYEYTCIFTNKWVVENYIPLL